MKKDKKNYGIYMLMLLIFGSLIYGALDLGEKFSSHEVTPLTGNLSENAFGMFKMIITNNLHHSLTILLFQIIVILIFVRLFSHIFKYIGQPGVIGEIVAGIVLGPSVLGYFFPDFFHTLFPADSLTNLELLSQIGLVLFMFVIGMEVDFGMLKNKMNETLVISHAGIIVPFFLGIVSSFWIYEEYAAHITSFLPFALFIGISMSITAFPVLARIIQERNMTKTPIGVLSIASAANDDVTAWCLLAIVIAVAKAGTFLSALYTVGLTLLFILLMFAIIRPFLRKIGETYANSEVINKSFVGFIFLVLIISSVTTEIIGIHALFGAFIAGVVMPVNLGFRKVMMEKVEDVALVFFLPLFFAFTGLRTEIGLINTPELWWICALLISIAILGKLGGCTIAARLVGESWKDSLTVGTLMNTRGLMELVALNIGYEMGVLPPEIFVILILMALITTFMTTPLLKLNDKIFKAVVHHKSGQPKLILSFGRPESGKLLLNLANRLFGQKLKQTHVIATHYTLGTDLNPVKAKQYAKESFKPLDEVNAQLKLNIEKRYKVTDRLINQMRKDINHEKPDLLLIGAGPQFMQTSPETAAYKIQDPVMRLFRKIEKESFRLPGVLLKDKLQDVVEKINSPVAIFVNRNYKDLKHTFLYIDQKEDLSIIDFLQGPFITDTVIQLCSTSRELVPAIQQRASKSELWDTNILLLEEISTPQSDSLLILSYESCQKLGQTPALLNALPSLLVLHLTTEI